MATLTALAAARARHEPSAAARGGLGRLGRRMMTIYASDEVHMSVTRAARLLGLGSEAVRLVPTDRRFRIDVAALEARIRADRGTGHRPFCVVATAGSVNTGAVDPMRRVARVARRHRLWLHVDAAYGGPLRLSPRHRSLLAGMEEADSVALDPHKWLYAPLDAGCVLFRDAAAPGNVFGAPGEYAAVLAPGGRESHAFFEEGPDLSRRFRALKVWMILKYHGVERLGRRIGQEVDLARRLADLVRSNDELELLAPVQTSIVCFRYRGRRGGHRAGEEADLDDLNRRVLLAVQRAGQVYLSNARVRGRFALRACIVNFRTTERDLPALIAEVVRLGRRLSRG